MYPGKEGSNRLDGEKNGIETHLRADLREIHKFQRPNELKNAGQKGRETSRKDRESENSPCKGGGLHKWPGRLETD